VPQFIQSSHRVVSVSAPRARFRVLTRLVPTARPPGLRGRGFARARPHPAFTRPRRAARPRPAAAPPAPSDARRSGAGARLLSSLRP